MVATGKAPKSLAGLSINAVGSARKREDGGVVVEAISYAHSVDDVTTPAAGGGYVESVQGDALAQALIEAMTYDEWVSGRPAIGVVAAGTAPKSLAGLAVNAVGSARKREDGGVVVEAISYAHSVDDVTTPAAGGGYVESVQGDALAQALIEAMTYDEWVSARP